MIHGFMLKAVSAKEVYMHPYMPSALLVASKVARSESCFGTQMLRSSSRRCVEKLIEVRTFCATLLSMLRFVSLSLSRLSLLQG